MAWRLGGPVGFGTIANAVLVGGTIQLLTLSGWVTGLAHTPLAERIGLMAGGLAGMGLGSGLYLGARLGAGPRDAVMLVGAERTRFRVGVVRAALEICAVGAGFALGGTVGIGTLAFALLIGPTVEGSFWLLERTPLAVAVTA